MITTAKAQLILVPLTTDHCEAVYELVQRNRCHLTAHGDYAELVAASQEAVRAALEEKRDNGLRLGIFLGAVLIGCMDLVAVSPPRYGLGYWLAAEATGKGYATAALNALIDFARTELKATDIFAGVTHGNRPSVAVLERAGFLPIETYTRFHCSLTSPK